MISVEDWAEIRRLHRAEQMPVRAIARKLGIARNTVRRAIADDAPPKYQRALKGSIVDAVEPQIRELLEQWPEMPATVIAERIGWDRGLTVLKDRVRDLRPAYRPADPASRTVYEPGEIGQCDLWFPPADIPLGFGQVGRPPVLVMVAGYSRWITARMLPSRAAADLIAGHWRLLTELGAVPRVLVWDNEGAVGSWRSGGPQLTDDFAAFAGLLGIKFRDLLLEGHHSLREAGHHGGGQVLTGQRGVLGLSCLDGGAGQGSSAFDLAVLQPRLQAPRTCSADGCRRLVAGQKHDRALVRQVERPLQGGEDLQQLGPEAVDLPGAVEDEVQAPVGQGAQVYGNLVAGPQQTQVPPDAGLVGDDEGVLRVGLSLAR
ncbi:Helix-turn-helix domain of resolvase [Streptomyces sp. 2231.1]|nr:Helix-turn-helix domain of resolvase [Streptomyces sp. 2231.1]